MYIVNRKIYSLILNDGKIPIEEFLSGIRDVKTRARIIRQIDKVNRGNFGNHREFGGIGELKIDIGPGYRIYYGKYGDVIVLLLGGGDKKSQDSDIKAAIARWETWKKEGASLNDFPVWSDDEDNDKEDEEGREPDETEAV